MTMKHCKGLQIDLENIEGDVILPKEFDKLNNLEKLDILADWEKSLRWHYDRIYREFMREMKVLRAAAKNVKGSDT